MRASPSASSNGPRAARPADCASPTRSARSSPTTPSPSLRPRGGRPRTRGGVPHVYITAQIEALEGQLVARDRIRSAHDLACTRIGATTARIEQLAAQLTEISLLSDRAAAQAALPHAREEVAGLVDEVRLVQQALDEIEGGPWCPVRR